MKKIAVIGLNYYPEESSTGLYTTEMCNYLKDYYHVEVITGYPYYPEWEIKKEYKEKIGVIEEEINGIKIKRVKQYTPKKVNPLNRLYHYYDFYKKAFNVVKNSDYDLGIVILPNIFLLQLGIKMKAMKKMKKIWAHVQDFEIDAGLETLKWIGKITPVVKTLHSIERHLFKKYDVVSSISESMVKKLEDKEVDLNKRYFFPNWADISKLYFKEESVYRKELNISSDEFVVMYSGNIGGKQDWETVIKGIKKLPDIKFVIGGDGSYLNELKRKIGNRKNVILLPLQPKERLNEFLNLGDLHIIPQKKEAKDSFMPSKLLGIMGVSRPVLALANRDSDLSKVIKEHNIGYVLNEDEYENIYKIIENARLDKELKIKGGNGNKYLKNNFIYEVVMEKLHSNIEKILEEKNDF